MLLRLLLLACLMLAACAAPSGPTITPRLSGGSKADAVVSLSSTTSIYHPVGPDWRVAEAKAAKRCRAWGHDGARSFAGWREACRDYDRFGRCVLTETTRFYACDG